VPARRSAGLPHPAENVTHVVGSDLQHQPPRHLPVTGDLVRRHPDPRVLGDRGQNGKIVAHCSEIRSFFLHFISWFNVYTFLRTKRGIQLAMPREEKSAR
jgi:hypothetical protein